MIDNEFADLLRPRKKGSVKLGVLGQGNSMSVNGQQYANAPRVGVQRPASGMTALTLRVAGGTEESVIALGGYYAPQTTHPVEEP